jgi:hypothetical protein
MKFDDLATVERPGLAVGAHTVIAIGDWRQDEALIPSARHGYSALCRKCPKSDLSQNALLRVRWSMAAGEARRGEGDDEHEQAESQSSNQMRLHDCDRRAFDAVFYMTLAWLAANSPHSHSIVLAGLSPMDD